MSQLDGVAQAPVVLVRGSDAVLVHDAVIEIDRLLVGDAQREFCVEELSLDHLVTESGDIDVGRVVDAAHTPAFLADRRVVVARGLGVLTRKDDVAALVEYLVNPLESTALVLVWDKPEGGQRKTGPPPKALVTAVQAAGGLIVDTDPGTGKKAAEWLDEHLADESFRFDGAARARLVDFLGEQPDRLVGVLTTLRGVIAKGAVVGVDDLEPYLGLDGDVTPWTLTDAIDSGDATGALVALQRMLGSGERHPLQIMATLTTHVGAMLALDGAEVTGKDDAAKLLGMHPFRAGKLLVQSRQLGSERLADFVNLLAQADIDLRGAKAWPDNLVVEVLVARLASRSGGDRRRRTAGR
jgi:DNA polymerase-3 subunit delta